MTAQEIIDAGLYNAAVNFMDDEIRDQLNAEMAPCTALEFLEAYMERHKKKYHAEFIIN